MNKDMGGPAFPAINCMKVDGICKSDSQGGATLWDYFAAHAPEMGEDNWASKRRIEYSKAIVDNTYTQRSDIELIAEFNANFADVMITEHKKRMGE